MRRSSNSSLHCTFSSIIYTSFRMYIRVIYIYSQFWYLDLVGVVLPAKVVPGPRPGRIRVRVGGCGAARHKASAAPLDLGRLRVVLLKLQLQRRMMNDGTALQDYGRARPARAQLRVVERRLLDMEEKNGIG